MSPKSANKAQKFGARELTPGKIIACPYEDSLFELFTIVGTSHTEVALVRIFEEKDITTVLSSKCTRLLRALTLSAPLEKLHYPLYADVTKLFYQQKETLLLYLNNTTFVFAGKIHKKDLSEILDALLKCNTISVHEKTSFLTF